jgi:hypothetical protein
MSKVKPGLDQHGFSRPLARHQGLAEVSTLTAKNLWAIDEVDT